MAKELEPSPQALAKMMAEMREWLEAERIPNARNDDHAILQFLFGCKLRMDVAKRKMNNYLEMRRSNPDWFEDRDPRLPHISSLLDLGVFLPLPVKDKDGRYVVLVRATINNPRENPMTDVFKVGMMVVDLLMEEDLTIAKKGVVVVIDLAGVGLLHSVQMTPNLIKKAVHSWQDCYPVRINSIVFVNCPVYVNVVLNIFKSFMRDKLRRRVQVYGRNLTGARDTVGAELLPDEYGGGCGPLEPVRHKWAAKVRERREWYMQDVTTTAKT